MRWIRYSEIPLITYLLIGSIGIVSIPTLFDSSLYELFGGVGDLAFPWQPMTAVFEHGWPGVPLLPHLIGNTILLWLVGRLAEKSLGSARYFVLTGLALALYLLLRQLAQIEVNGASVYIWAYAPIVYLGYRECRKPDRECVTHWDPIPGILWVMWAIVPAGMGIITASQGINIGPAFFLGNLFHLSGTMAGLIGLLIWSDEIRDRVVSPVRQDSIWNFRAKVVSLGIPLFLLSLIILWYLGLISL